MNIYCLCNNKNVNFDSIAKTKCWGQSVALLCATSGLHERVKEKEVMGVERQRTQGWRRFTRDGNMEEICEEHFKRKELICRRIAKSHGEETERQIWGCGISSARCGLAAGRGGQW